MSKSDQSWLRWAMGRFGVRKLRVVSSLSTAKWPDLWVSLSTKPPVLTVTKEWARQPVQERRKRLTHELVGHLIFNWPHDKFMESIGFSTYPKYDKISQKIYYDLLNGIKKKPKEYIEEALNE